MLAGFRSRRRDSFPVGREAACFTGTPIGMGLIFLLAKLVLCKIVAML